MWLGIMQYDDQYEFRLKVINSNILQRKIFKNKQQLTAISFTLKRKELNMNYILCNEDSFANMFIEDLLAILNLNHDE